jgi:hypothetical protein
VGIESLAIRTIPFVAEDVSGLKVVEYAKSFAAFTGKQDLS